MTDSLDHALEQFMSHLDLLSEEAGVTLTTEQREQLLRESVSSGFTPESTIAAFEQFAPGDELEEPEHLPGDAHGMKPADEEVDAGTMRLAEDIGKDIDRMKGRLGRPLTGRELEVLAGGALEQVQRTGRFDAEKALSDHYEAHTDEVRPNPAGTQAERQAFFQQRLSDLEKKDEPDADRVFDLDNDRDRREYLTARARGEDFEDTEDDTLEAA